MLFASDNVGGNWEFARTVGLIPGIIEVAACLSSHRIFPRLCGLITVTFLWKYSVTTLIGSERSESLEIIAASSNFPRKQSKRRYVAMFTSDRFSSDLITLTINGGCLEGSALLW